MNLLLCGNKLLKTQSVTVHRNTDIVQSQRGFCYFNSRKLNVRTIFNMLMGYKSKINFLLLKVFILFWVQLLLYPFKVGGVSSKKKKNLTKYTGHGTIFFYLTTSYGLFFTFFFLCFVVVVTINPYCPFSKIYFVTWN